MARGVLNTLSYTLPRRKDILCSRVTSWACLQPCFPTQLTSETSVRFLKISRTIHKVVEPPPVLHSRSGRRAFGTQNLLISSYRPPGHPQLTTLVKRLDIRSPQRPQSLDSDHSASRNPEDVTIFIPIIDANNVLERPERIRFL